MCAYEGYELGAHDIIHDFQLQDFIDDGNFDQFINLIRGENEDAEAQFDLDLISGSCFNNDQLLITPTIDPVSHFGFDHNTVNTTNQCDQTPFPTSLTSLPSSEKQSNNDQDDEDDDEDEDSCGTTTTATTTKKPKADRSRTLVSERKRRGRMKDKLYALRALVPNITKVRLIFFI